MWHVWPSFLEWPDLRFLASGLSCELSHDRHVRSSDPVLLLGLMVKVCWQWLRQFVCHFFFELLLNVGGQNLAALAQKPCNSCDIYPKCMDHPGHPGQAWIYKSHFCAIFWHDTSSAIITGKYCWWQILLFVARCGGCYALATPQWRRGLFRDERWDQNRCKSWWVIVTSCFNVNPKRSLVRESPLFQGFPGIEIFGFTADKWRLLFLV